ncbi:unnamed protein product [Pedinophyceae sp. YPF-701]|nr:unnamed protein product [Pedinophyceae sp. YPF-701]
MADVPANANEGCPGTGNEGAGKASACAGCPNQAVCASGVPPPPDPDLALIERRMSRIKHKILVLSGKGGVGKSTLSAQLAFALAQTGKQVGLMDIDICGPSVPRMLGLEGEEIHQSASGWSPVYVDDNLGVMSIGFMLGNPDDAVIWRGPRKNGLIKQFMKDVDWGDLDYLVIDAPPGTSDEHISIVQLLRATPADGAVVVTTPQGVALADVRKEVNFCKKVSMPMLGVVENMSGLVQRLPQCSVLGASGEDLTQMVSDALSAAGLSPESLVVRTDVFHAQAGGEGMARGMGVAFLGRVPLDPAIGRAAEEGRSVLEDASALSGAALRGVLEALVARLDAGGGAQGCGV